MAISHVQPGQALPSSTLNAMIDGVNQAALTGIVPTTVAGTGVTVSANGSVTCSNTTKASLNGVFTGGYDNYRIVWNVPTRSAGASLVWQLRQTGTDVTATDYNWSRGYDSGTSRTVNSGTATTSLPCDFAFSATMTSDGYMDLFGPAKAGYTSTSGIAALWSGTATASLTTSGYVALPSASDGISFSLTSGTFSGMFRIYGYNNLT